MKKITLFISAGECDDALARLQQLGVLHIHHQQAPVSDETAVLEKDIEDVETALAILKEPAAEHATHENAQEAAGEILVLEQRRHQLLAEKSALQKQLQWYEKWGEVSPASVETLREKGTFVRFYQMNAAAFRKLEPENNIQVQRREKDKVYFALFGSSADERLDINEETLPEMEKTDVENRLANLASEMTATEASLQKLSSARNSLVAHRDELKSRLDFHKTRQGMGMQDAVCYLSGFCPLENVADIISDANSRQWGYLVESVDDVENAPTLVRNPRWVDIIKPVFNFMGTIPGYREYDISLWFLIFLTIFFALLIGDAGYGVIFLAVTMLFRGKLRQMPGNPLPLMVVSSIATIIWGAISGNWFGVEKIALLPFFDSLVIDRLNAFSIENQSFMMYICFVVAVVHLSIARLTAGIRQINSLKILAELGWISILWAMFFLAGNLVLFKPLPDIAMPLLLGGFLLVLFFSNPQRNILKGVGATIINLPLDIIGSFSDIVSYIRLFAVGYATLIVAASFNEMALGIGFNSILSGFISSLILFLGHGINIILALMAVVVHGVRLNMLEFSGHLNMQWSGNPYQPFKK